MNAVNSVLKAVPIPNMSIEKYPQQSVVFKSYKRPHKFDSAL